MQSVSTTARHHVICKISFTSAHEDGKQQQEEEEEEKEAGEEEEVQ